MNANSIPSRRTFLGTAAVGLSALTPLTQAAGRVTERSDALGTIHQVNAGLLNVGYADLGPAEGPVVVLLHGWPYDIHSFIDVAPLLASAGYRVIVPHLRGHGSTRFLSKDTLRNGQQAVVALDVIALLDALEIRKASFAAFDWGARTAGIIAALWPERCQALVSVSGYLINNREAIKAPLPPAAEYAWWYQFYLATEHGRLGYERNRAEFAKLIWRTASPKWAFDDATFNRSAASFDNPDHVDVVVHNYRWRQSLADGERIYDDLERRLAAGPTIAVPTIVLEGDANGAPHFVGDSAFRHKFTGPLRVPPDHGRHRAQPATGSARGLRPGRARRVPHLIPSLPQSTQEQQSMSRIDHVLYTGRTHTRGGRDGLARSDDGRLDIQLSRPGGGGPGTNPEQLFAAGWSACFIGAMGHAARAMKVTLPEDVSVVAEVDLGTGEGGFYLQARLNVCLPGLESAVARSLVEAAHATCPYSKATRGNIAVAITLV